MLKFIMPLTLLLLSKKIMWMSSPLMFMLLMLTIPLMMPLENMMMITSSIFTMDALSSPLVILTMWMTVLMITVSYKIFYNNSSPLLFIKMVMMLLISLILTFTTNNMILFYIMFEASLIPTLMLILIWGYQPERMQASMYMMIYTIVASLPLLINISTMFMNNPHLNMLMLMWNTSMLLSPMLWWTLCLLAFMVKLPLYSVHLWLPKAHVEAPVAGSMILAGILLKLGGYGILRLSYIFQQMTHSLMIMFSPIALLGAMLTSFICIRQTDMKAMIAYSSIAHMGIMISATMMSSTWAWNATLMMMIAHGICSPALFALANMTYEKSNTRSVILTKGFMMISPIMSFWWFVFTASNMAAPPFINLMSEIMLICSLLSSSISFMLPIFMLSFMVVVYSLHLFTLSQHGHLPLFSNSMPPMLSLNMLNNMSMFLPLVLLIMKVDVISAWF